MMSGDRDMSFPPKCSCGDDARYQNMANGQFIWTCGKRGCLKQKPVTTSSNSK